MPAGPPPNVAFYNAAPPGSQQLGPFKVSVCNGTRPVMTRKVLENRLLWIAVDVVYLPMYVYKGLCLTAALYAVFLVLAVLGYVQWRRSVITFNDS